MSDKELKVLGGNYDQKMFGEEEDEEVVDPETLKQFVPKNEGDGSDVPTSDFFPETFYGKTLPSDSIQQVVLEMFQASDEEKGAMRSRVALEAKLAEKGKETVRAVGRVTEAGSRTVDTIKQLLSQVEMDEELRKEVDTNLDYMVYLLYGLADK